jgi:RNA polymerase sigma-70 factor (ECF subfamily)
MQPSDHDLLARMAGGDREAFAAFYDRHAPRVLGLLCQTLGQRADAEDVLQVVFLEVWCTAAHYRPERASPLTWLALLTRSRAVDHLRRRKPAEPLPEAPRPAPGDGPDLAAERTEATARVRDALSLLPETQRSAICLAFFGGLSYEEVARHQGLPAGTVKTRIRLAMDRLRGLLTRSHEVSAP